MDDAKESGLVDGFDADASEVGLEHPKKHQQHPDEGGENLVAPFKASDTEFEERGHGLDVAGRHDCTRRALHPPGGRRPRHPEPGRDRRVTSFLDELDEPMVVGSLPTPDFHSDMVAESRRRGQGRGVPDDENLYN